MPVQSKANRELRESNIREEIRFIRTHLDAGAANYCGCWYVEKPEQGISGAAIARADYAELGRRAQQTGDMRLWNLIPAMPSICRTEPALP